MDYCTTNEDVQKRLERALDGAKDLGEVCSAVRAVGDGFERKAAKCVEPGART
jgi:hypothetical protein